MSPTSDDRALFEQVKQRAEDVASMLDSFGDRLRAMRRRNREMEEEIRSFETDLERVRDRLAQQLSESDKSG